MAPSVLLQMVGPRVANHVLERMNEAYPDRFLLGRLLVHHRHVHDAAPALGRGVQVGIEFKGIFHRRQVAAIGRGKRQQQVRHPR